MFKQKTTIIVGAGASCELGLPSGDGLKNQIVNLLRPTRDNSYGFADDIMIEVMKKRAGPNVWDRSVNIEPVKEAAQRIRKGLPLAPSIDNFLYSHQGDDEVVQLHASSRSFRHLKMSGKRTLAREADRANRKNGDEISARVSGGLS